MKRLIGLITLSLLLSCGKQADMRDLHDRIDDTNDKVSELETRLNQLYNSLNSLSLQVNDIDADQELLQQSIALNASNIAALENSQPVLSLYDPCGDDQGFDELLLIMQDGSIIAYFEQGNKRYLTKLVDGYYKTTDKTGCSFSVVDGEIVD